MKNTFGLADLDDLARELILSPSRKPGRLNLELPDWYQQGLDPYSDAYKRQQLKLWQAASRSRNTYDPSTNETAQSVIEGQPFSRAAIFRTGIASHAADHIMAIGHILKWSGVRAGSSVLEYGAGFGESALTFARLGAVVDTVDINAKYCNAINKMAKLAEVDLTAHVGLFGDQPRPGVLYDLIYFYEAFHHSADFIGKRCPDPVLLMAA